MTEDALATAEADFAMMNALTAYSAAVTAETDAAIQLMLASTASLGIGPDIKTAWLGVISTALSTATSQFASDPAT